MRCAWCELDLDETDRQSIRLSNTQPPWTLRAARGAALVVVASRSFSESLRAATGAEPPVELWFHRPCWHKLRALLEGRHEVV